MSILNLSAKKKAVVFFIGFASLTNYASIVSAQAENPSVNRVCVFDIDQTLIKDHGNVPNPRPYEQAQAAINTCLKQGYGVSIATNSRSLRRNVLDLFQFGYFDLYKNFVTGDYTNVTQTSPFINPLYIATTYRQQENESAHNGSKGDAMNRLMRSFYGYGINQADVTDYNNSYTKAYPNLDKKALSGCLVLFDDDIRNVRDIKHFNTKNGTRFQVVQVKKGQGVTPEDVKKGIRLLDKNCQQ